MEALMQSSFFNVFFGECNRGIYMLVLMELVNQAEPKRRKRKMIAMITKTTI
jgi:hypothetical protein